VLRNQALVPGGVGLAIVAVCLAMGYRGFMPLTAFGLAGFVTVTTVRELLLPARERMLQQKETAMTAFFRSATRTRRRVGGYMVHLAIVAIIVAIAASSAYKVHTTATLKPGEVMSLGAYSVRFDGLSNGKEGHRDWIAADITVQAPDGQQMVHHGLLGPRMNYYERSTDPMGSPMVQEMALRDVYVSLLAFDTKVGTASFNAWVFPLVGWIWYAIPFLVLGTLIALWPQRKQKAVSTPEAASAAVAQGS
jgi:cytochrome c-type biogenesis protein CcmF